MIRADLACDGSQNLLFESQRLPVMVCAGISIRQFRARDQCARGVLAERADIFLKLTLEILDTQTDHLFSSYPKYGARNIAADWFATVRAVLPARSPKPQPVPVM